MSLEPQLAVPDLSGARILVVDDNEQNLDMLSRRLQRRGFGVDTAASGIAALEALTQHTYDAVVLDIMMPGMSGIEVLEQIRKQFSKTQLPVLMATAKTESKDMVEALQLGANDYVTKPLDFPIVMARLETQVAIRRELAAGQSQPTVVAGTEGISKGTVLDGRYEVENRVGEGGFAVVYRARQLSTGQSVAVKFLRSQRLSDSSQGQSSEVARFQREMEVIAQATHPAIVRHIDSGTLQVDDPRVTFPRLDAERAGAQTVSVGIEDSEPGGGSATVGPSTIPYFVMEYLEGETLAQRLARDQSLDLESTLEILLPVISGVHVMHTQGVVHRDLKPANIFITREAHGPVHPKVLDFGIAKVKREGASDLTTNVAFVGTPTYMAPEQAMGEKSLDVRCDQYTLATVCYECLSGQRPYKANSYPHLLMKVAEADFVPLDQVCKAPKTVVDAIARAMRKEPNERYPNLLSFGRALIAGAPPKAKSRWQQIFDA